MVGWCGGGFGFRLYLRVTYRSHDTWRGPELFSKRLLVLLMVKVNSILDERRVIRDTYGIWLLDQVEERVSQCIGQ